MLRRFRQARRSERRSSGGGLILDALSANAAYSVTRKLKTAYAGFAYKASRDSDGATLDVGFTGNDVDTAALATWASGTTARLHTWYDQSGNARNLARTGSPFNILYTAGAVVTDGGKPTCQFTILDTWMERADSSGLSGDVDATFVIATGNGTGSFLTDVGGVPNETQLRVRMGPPGAGTTMRMEIADGRSRTFTKLTAPAGHICIRPAGTGPSGWTVYSGGAPLSVFSTDGSPATISFGTTRNRFAVGGAGNFLNANFWAVLDYVPNAGQIADLTAELALHTP